MSLVIVRLADFKYNSPLGHLALRLWIQLDQPNLKFHPRTSNCPPASIDKAMAGHFA
jgi:hypothetical protein